MKFTDNDTKSLNKAVFLWVCCIHVKYLYNPTLANCCMVLVGGVAVQNCTAEGK